MQYGFPSYCSRPACVHWRYIAGSQITSQNVSFQGIKGSERDQPAMQLTTRRSIHPRIKSMFQRLWRVPCANKMKEIYRRPERRAKVQQDDDSGSTTSKFIVSETTEQFWSLRCSANVANDIMEMTGVSQRRTSDVRREVAFLVSEENSKCSRANRNVRARACRERAPACRSVPRLCTLTTFSVRSVHKINTHAKFTSNTQFL